jgi:Uri superfamily endonuclease
MGGVVDQLCQIFPEAIPVDAANIFELGGETGAYALVIKLAEPVKFSRKALGAAELQGDLIYAGSANGPGGIKARLARHLKSEKTIRWHVDELTTRAAAVSALAIMGGKECEIVRQLLESGTFKPAMPGFGSSDCSNCAAHLLAYNAV